LIVVVFFIASGRPEAQQHDFKVSIVPVQSTKAKDLAAGKLLVANRNLGDPNFLHTVVLLVRYDQDGVVGLILNRRTRVPLSKALELEATKTRTDSIYLGGPVAPAAVFALFQSPTKVAGAEQVFDNLYQVHTKTLLETALSANPGADALRVYVGYAGWNVPQLQMEVALGSWFIFPGDAKAVFDSDPDSLWSRMIRKTDLQLAVISPDK
jgi:putative transcriptional regulator